MWWNQILFVIIGIGSGLIAAGGVFALLTIIGIVTKLAERTHTAAYICLYETVIILGAVIGNLINIYELKLYGGSVAMVIYGVFTGAFVGCLAISLAESLKVTSICMRRITIQKNGLKFVLLTVMLGKIIGSLLYYFRFGV